MWIYRNAHTGQTAELKERSARLDALANWHLVGAPLESDPDDAGPADPGPASPAPAPVRPPDTATKEVWVAYAIARGAKESDARALRKAALIEEWGGPDGED